MDVVSAFRAAVKIEQEALAAFLDRIDGSIAAAITALSECEGRIVVVGVGKSGIIGRKIAATLASVGSPAVFLHAAEALHGDFGFVGPGDVALILSSSGETPEIKAILPHIAGRGVPVVAMTSRPESSLGRAAAAVIDTRVEREADSMNLAPTASTTLMLAAGDGLACVLMRLRGFGEADYAKLHPGGSLGRRMLCRVDALMHAGDAMPVCAGGVALRTAIVEVTAKRLGCTLVADAEGKLAGIVTDGDLRRALQENEHPLDLPVDLIMTKAPQCAEAGWLAADALALMEEKLITMLPVVDAAGCPLGVLHIHDLVGAGIQ